MSIVRLRRGDTIITSASNTDVITLSGSGTEGTFDSAILGCSYRVNLPDQSVTRRNQFGVHGELISNIDFKNVTESCEIVVKDISTGYPDITGVFNLIQEFFFDAERYSETGYARPIYIEYSPSSTTEAVDYARAQIFRGRIELTDRVRTRMFQDGVGVFNLIWEREPSFENFSEIEAKLENDQTTVGGDTGGVRVYSTSEVLPTITRNWVSLRPNGTETEVPCHMRLDIDNNDPLALDLTRIYVGYNDWSDLSSLRENALIVEAESANQVGTPPPGEGTWTSTAAGTASAGNYLKRVYTFPSALSEIDLGTYDINNDAAGTRITTNLKGNGFRVFCLFYTSPPAGFEFRMRIEVLATGEIIQYTPWVGIDPNFDFQDLGVIKLPPALRYTSPLDGIRLTVEMRNASSGAQTLDVDYLSLMPINQWRYYFPAGSQGTNSLHTTEVLVDDGVFSDSVYVRQTNNERFIMHRPVGPPWRFPVGDSQNNRMYFMWEMKSPTVQTLPVYRCDVSVFYKPRFILPA